MLIKTAKLAIPRVAALVCFIFFKRKVIPQQYQFGKNVYPTLGDLGDYVIF